VNPPTLDAIEHRLLQTIRQLQPDIVHFCSRLIQIPSVNGVHDELDLAQAIDEQAQALGLHVQFAGENPRRPNLIVSTAAEGETGLLLLGHLDTVPGGDENHWSVPAFSGRIAGGKIYGRGAIDTKGGMAAALYALATLKHVAGDEMRGRAQLICVPDEESGATGTLGIKYLYANGLLYGKGAIYAYSGRQITLGHRGLIRYRLHCKGEAIHTGAAEWQEGRLGANAVTGMARLLTEIEALEAPYSTAKYFERFRTVFTPGTMVNGGVSINIVPDTCEALMDIRLTPEFNQARVEDLLAGCIERIVEARPKLQFTYELLNYAPSAISDDESTIVKVLESVVETVTATKPERVVAGPANEGYLLIERGIPTICGFGPTGENAHATDEYVDILGLVEAAEMFSLTAWRMSNMEAQG
jgi:acetylornithine deacetylase/succinyl-diaminopimelate desuccinylase-like protein